MLKRFVLFLVFCFFSFPLSAFSTLEIEDSKNFSIKISSNTNKLVLRNPEKEDKKYYLDIFSNVRAMEKYMDGKSRPEDEINERFAEYYENTKAHSPWNSYLIFDTHPSQPVFIGHVMLEPSDRDYPDELEISYVLLPDFWTKGFGTKAVNMLLEVVKNKLRHGYKLNSSVVKRVYATARPDNPASCKILEKNKFRHVETVKKFEAERLHIRT